MNNYFVIDSHRGAFKDGLLENSIPAFTASYYEGANCVECDIRRTKDEEIVLIHNSTIDHIASFAEKIPDESEFGEIPKGKVSSHNLPYLKSFVYPNEAEILTLEEFLNLIKLLKIGAQIELKEFGYEDQILQIIEDAAINYEELLAPVVCTSFNWLSIKKMIKKSGYYDIPLYSHDGGIGQAFGFQAISVGAFYGKWVLRRFHKYNVWGGMTHYRYMPVERLDYAHKMGVKFCPRIPNDRQLALNYLKNGVDGFETDDISFVRSCVKEAGRADELTPVPNQ